MKVNIPGAREGMYMSTDSLMTDVRPSVCRETMHWRPAAWWRVKGDSWVVRSYRMYVWTKPISV